MPRIITGLARNFKREFLIFPILILGLILRVIGLNWGLPGTKFFHSYSLHSDETSVLHMIRSMKPKELNFKLYSHPIQYGCGVFHAYVATFGLGVAAGLRLITIKSDYDWYKSNPKELAKIYLAGRAVNVLLGVLCLFLLYRIGTLAFNSSVGLLSSFMLSIAPIHVVNSHYFSRDMTMIVCLLLAVLCLLSFKKRPWLSFMLGGFFIGLSAAAKHVAGSFAVFIPLAILLNIESKERFGRSLLLAFGILGCLVGFLIGHPYVLVDFKEYWQALKETAPVTMALGLCDATYSSGGLRFYLGEALYYGLGLPLMAVVYLGILFALIKRTKWDLFFLFGILPYLFITSQSSWKFVRWILVVTPFLVLFGARFVYEIAHSQQLRRSRYVYYAALVLIFSYTLGYSFAYVWAMSQKEVHVEASEWIVEHIPFGETIGVRSVPFMWHPTLVIQEYFYKEGDPARQGQKQLYSIINLEDSLDQLRKREPAYIVLSDFEYAPIIYLRKKFPDVKFPFMEEVFYGKTYKEVITFKKEPSLFGLKFVRGFYPHDWRYPFPEIKIFKLYE